MNRRLLLIPMIAMSSMALAWDETGHRVVARVAWDTLGKTEQGKAARSKFVAILAKGDENYTPADDTDVEAFVDCANWADAIKRKDYSSNLMDLVESYNDETYPSTFPDRGKDSENNRLRFWHYFDTPLNLAPDVHPFERPYEANKALHAAFDGIKTGDDRHKAFWAYWILHLGGDLHQPLHCVSDFTNPVDAKSGLTTGDNGGNSFTLSGSSRNLHSYWDSAITRATGPARSTAKRAKKAEEAFPESTFGPEVDDLEPSHWIAEGAKLAQSTVYKGVTSGEAPGEEYIQAANQTALRQAALGGYRMARLIQKLIG